MIPTMSCTLLDRVINKITLETKKQSHRVSAKESCRQVRHLQSKESRGWSRDGSTDTVLSGCITEVYFSECWAANVNIQSVPGRAGIRRVFALLPENIQRTRIK